MTFDLAQMIADREAGTPGEWFINGPTWNQIVWTDNETRLCFMTHSNGLNDARDEANARRIASVPLFEAEIIRLTARVAELEGALAGCVAAIEHADMSDGVCCCGDNMEGHSDPMNCGHSPTDMGEYHASQVLSVARAALSTPAEEPKT